MRKWNKSCYLKLYYAEHTINLVSALLPLSEMVQVSVEAFHYLRKQSPCTYINHTYTCTVRHITLLIMFFVCVVIKMLAGRQKNCASIPVRGKDTSVFQGIIWLWGHTASDSVGTRESFSGSTVAGA